MQSKATSVCDYQSYNKSFLVPVPLSSLSASSSVWFWEFMGRIHAWPPQMKLSHAAWGGNIDF